ncbi:glutamate receptor ionotropic, delta-2-like isoform X2 [Daphnia pulicaria]|uniref:glutamate receptor ionotropic, delta-2-like isoform X2 n=1 Tax=Daphnia pulicaria TaxID=35523 RepID=UPI001EE9CCAA|nr:glutamate receptor ionotropic, delta-2-like isoform X2 [Daphnia pulicaria]
MTFRFLTILAVAITNCHFMTVNSSPSMKTGDLNGAHLKIAVAHYPPFHNITLMPNGNYSIIGAGVEYFAWLEKKLNFTFSYDFIPNEVTKAKYGIKSNLAIMTNLFTDKEIDGASTGITLTLENKKKMDLAYFAWSEPFKMVVPRPGEKSRLLAFVYPFDPLVWGLIYITIHAMVASMTFFASIYSKFSINGREVSAIYGGRTVYDRVSYYMIYVFNIMTNQGNMIHVSRLSFRILVGSWLLVATVLVYSYSSTVVSHLTIVVTKPHINSLEDLAASKDVELLLLADFFPEEILDAKFGALKYLGDQIRYNPDRLLNNMQNVETLLGTGSHAMPFLATVCKNFVATQFKKDRKRRFVITDPISSANFWSLPFQKDSSYTWAFHHALIELWESGLPYHWVGNFVPQVPESLLITNNKHKANSVRRGAIRLEDLTGAFLILGVGFGLATFTFILEKIVYFRNKRKTEQQEFQNS